MADNYVIRIATARRIGGAHRKVRDVTARLSDMKEREGVLRCIANTCLAFSHCEIQLADSFILLGPPGWYLMEIMFRPPGIEPGTI